jgi:hypothetical protein
MIAPGTTWRNPRTGATLVVAEWTPQRAVFVRLMRPGTGHTDAHYHRDFDQSWECLEGVLTCTVDGRTRRLQPGERQVIPRGVPHRDPYNDSDADLRFNFVIEPCPYFVEVFARSLGDLMERDKTNDQGEFSNLQILGVLHAGRADSWLARIPLLLQKPLVAIGGRLSRRLGYRPIVP